MEETKRVLNLGSAAVDMHADHYAGWDVVSFDIDEESGADIIGDARRLKYFDEMQFDAVHMSHLLEHFYDHENLDVLEGIHHVLKPDGFCDIYVPDVIGAFGVAMRVGKGMRSRIYESESGPISLHQVIYGYGNNEYMAHMQGFDMKRLIETVAQVFHWYVVVQRFQYEIGIVVFKDAPTWQLDLLRGKK